MNFTVVSDPKVEAIFSILTYLQEETITQDDFTIRVVPAWKWLISGS